MESKYLIYALIDPTNGEVRYVGQSSRGIKRPQEHLKESYYNGSGRNRHLYCWIRSCLEKEVVPKIQVLTYCFSKGELNQKEIEYIKYYKNNGSDLCNLTEGGEGSVGYKPTPETILKLKESHYGQRRQMPESERQYRKGLRKNFILSKETLAKIGSTMKGRVGNTPRPVLRSDGKKYGSVSIAAEELNVAESTLRKCIKDPMQTCKGFTFSYAPHDILNNRAPIIPRGQFLDSISVRVIRSDGLIFETVRAAAIAINANPSHVCGAIKSNGRCKGFYFQKFSDSTKIEEYVRFFEELKKKPRGPSEKLRQASRERMLGKKLSAEIREKISQAKKGKKLSSKGLIDKCGKVATQIIRSDGKIYKSIGDAAKELNVVRASITRSIKRGGKCKGFTFAKFVPNV